MLITNRHNQPISLAGVLGKGGEATVYSLHHQPNQVAKIYHRPTEEQAAKLTAMLATPPHQPTTHTAIAWPLEQLYRDKQCVGFIMPKIIDSHSIFTVFNPIMRARVLPRFNWQALHQTAYNLAVVVSAVHAKGHVIGDINESNILVNHRALVSLVDTDSFQISTLDDKIYRCKVGKPEYTPPELQGVRFTEVNQTIHHDNFSLGILLFQLLMNGFHPFAGVLQTRESVGRVDLYGIKEGLFPYQANPQLNPPPHAPPFAILSPLLQSAFIRCFVEGYQHPLGRPTATEWISLLETSLNNLVHCPNNPRHLFANHQTECGWCMWEAHQQKQQTIQQPISVYHKPPPPINPTYNPQPKQQPLPSLPTQLVPQGPKLFGQWFGFHSLIGVGVTGAFILGLNVGLLTLPLAFLLMLGMQWVLIRRNFQTISWWGWGSVIGHVLGFLGMFVIFFGWLIGWKNIKTSPLKTWVLITILTGFISNITNQILSIVTGLPNSVILPGITPISMISIVVNWASYGLLTGLSIVWIKQFQTTSGISFWSWLSLFTRQIGQQSHSIQKRTKGSLSIATKQSWHRVTPLAHQVGQIMKIVVSKLKIIINQYWFIMILLVMWMMLMLIIQLWGSLFN